MRCVVTEPDHVRAQNNKAYYEQLIKEEEENRRKGDEGPPPPVKNKRILDEYRQSEEFATYEALCRGEDTHVSVVITRYETLPCFKCLTRYL